MIFTLANIRHASSRDLPPISSMPFVRCRAFDGAVDKSPVITEVWAVDTPVGARRGIHMFLAARPIAHHQVRILFRLYLPQSLACQFAVDRAVDPVVQ